jgi:mRNA interferase MazF
LEVPLPAGLAVGGVILSDQVKSLDWRTRNAEWIARIPEGTILQVLDRIRALLPGIAR